MNSVSEGSFGALDWILFPIVPIVTLTFGAFHGMKKAPQGEAMIEEQETPDEEAPNGTSITVVVPKRQNRSDLTFSILFFTSIFVLFGFSSHVYYNGSLSLLGGGLPAVLTAHLVSISLFLPAIRAKDAPANRWSQYLRLRFQSSTVGNFLTILIAVCVIIFTGTLLNGLSSVFTEISGLGDFASGSIVLLVTVIYVVIEGKTCFLWSDIFLSVFIVLSITVVILSGLANAGGLSEIIRNVEAKENLNDDVIINVFCGHFILWLGIITYIMSASDFHSLKQLTLGSNPFILLSATLPIAAVAFILVSGLGAVMASQDRMDLEIVDCEQRPKRWPDRIVTKIVTQRFGTAQNMFGLPGLMTASIFAQTFSIISTALNSLTQSICKAITDQSSIQGYMAAGEVGGAISSGPPIDRIDTQTPLEFTQRRILPRVLAAILVFLSGILSMTLLGDKLMYSAIISTVGIIIGVSMGILTLALFFPYATTRGATIGAILVLLLGLWVSSGGLFHSKGPLETLTEKHCGKLDDLDEQGRRISSTFPDQMLPSGIQTAGRVNEKNSAPGFLIPKRNPDISNNKNYAQIPPVLEVPKTFLPRSPLFGGALVQALTDSRISDPKALEWSSASSPHVQQQNSPQLPANRNTNAKISSEFNSLSQLSSQAQYSPGVMNKPPLVLAKPEEHGNQSKEADVNDQVVDFTPHGKGIYHLSHHLYGICAMCLTLVLGLIFSFRCPAWSAASGMEDFDDYDQPTITSTMNPQSVTHLDPRLLHPIARAICCKCCSERRVKQRNNISISMDQRQSLMAASSGGRGSLATGANPDDYYNALHRHGSRRSRNSEDKTAGDLSRRCSKHSHMSKRSSLGSNNQPAGQTTTTTADVLAPYGGHDVADISPQPQAIHHHKQSNEIGRRQSAPDDQEKMPGAVRRDSGSSSGVYKKLSPQMSLAVPQHSANIALQHSPISPRAHLTLPTDEELTAQRRFSEVNAAIERHNSRRKAKRSQSVMYRPQRRNNRRRSHELDQLQVDPAFRDRTIIQRSPNVPHHQFGQSLKPPIPLQATLSAPPTTSPSQSFTMHMQ